MPKTPPQTPYVETPVALGLLFGQLLQELALPHQNFTRHSRQTGTPCC
jgi:hypothetical protein